MNSHINFQAEVISPSEELLNNQVINDFDIEEDEIEIENRLVITAAFDFFCCCNNNAWSTTKRKKGSYMYWQGLGKEFQFVL